MRRNTCPCCGNTLLRHARTQGIYWFCTSCRQEMMPLSGENTLCQEILLGRSRIPETANS